MTKTREEELKENINDICKKYNIYEDEALLAAYDSPLDNLIRFNAELKGISEGRRLQKIEDDKETMKCIQDYSEKLREEGKHQALEDVEKILKKQLREYQKVCNKNVNNKECKNKDFWSSCRIGAEVVIEASEEELKSKLRGIK